MINVYVHVDVEGMPEGVLDDVRFLEAVWRSCPTLSSAAMAAPFRSRFRSSLCRPTARLAASLTASSAHWIRSATAMPGCVSASLSARAGATTSTCSVLPSAGTSAGSRRLAAAARAAHGHRSPAGSALRLQGAAASAGLPRAAPWRSDELRGRRGSARPVAPQELKRDAGDLPRALQRQAPGTAAGEARSPARRRRGIDGRKRLAGR
jgi:hypothetical protein